MNLREHAQLRTKLRRVNIEYSSLVRDPPKEGRFVRMTALRMERRAIMSLLFGSEPGEHRVATVLQPMSAIAILRAVESSTGA